MTHPAGRAIRLAAGPSIVRPSCDFETYSEAGYRLTADGKVQSILGPGKTGGLPVVGTPRYAEHPSTEAVVLRYDLKDGHGMRYWRPGQPNPMPLLDHVERGGELAAWNVAFEWYVWNCVCVPQYGWPPLALEQLYCDMAKANRYALPGKLEVAAQVTGGAQKDKTGKALIQKLSRPHTPTKKRPSPRWTRETAPEDFAAFDEYCADDVRAEDGVSAHTPELTPEERRIWLADQRINARGVQVDTVALADCMAVLALTEQRFTAELRELTGGEVPSVDGPKLGEWLALSGYPLPNMKAETVQDALDGKLAPLPPGPCRRALEIRALLSSANIKKLRTLSLQVSRDGRLRDQYQYCGARATGRWSSGGVQLQNLTAKGPELGECEACGELFGWQGQAVPCPRCGAGDWLTRHAGEWEGELAVRGVERALQDTSRRDLDHMLRVWGDPIAALCGCLRGLFIAAPGKQLICVDFTAIEAVVLACLARCMWRVDTFASGRSIYLESVSRITGTSYEEYEQYKRERDTHHPDRKLGKVAELASGFAGWVGAWIKFGALKYMEEDAIKPAIKAWHAASPEVVELWGDQYRKHPDRWEWTQEFFGLEGAAIQAVMFPGQPFSLTQCDVTYVVHDDVLWCVLPSGRRLYYHRPRVTPTQDRLNRGPYWSLSVEQYNTNAQKGPVGWHRQELWKGILVENVVQAVARDLQAAAMVRCEDAGYTVVMHTHDELTAEVPEGQGSVEHMAQLMTERPAWASWWPIKAAGWAGRRYRKD